MSKIIYYIKSFLKRSEQLKKLNAIISSATLEREYERLFKNVTPSLSSLNDETLDSLKSKVQKKISNNDKPRIIWVGANYQQDYSGFIQALSKVGDVTVFTRSDGIYGLEAPTVRENLIFDEERKKNSDRLYSIFLESGGSNGVDIVIGQMWSTLIDPQVLEKIRSTGVIVLNVAMDDKLPVHWKSDSSDRLAGSIGLAENVDLTLNTSKQAITLYAERGCSCVYWPLASDGGVFSPVETKVHDVVFIGSNYGVRSKIISELIAAGIDVKAFGPGFPSGLLSPEESAKIFGEAKIVLGIGFVGYSQRISTLKLRDFDALFTGALYITSRNEDLEEIFTEDENIVFYDSTNELIEKVKYYLANEEQRNSIALRALEDARANHLWEKRLRDTFLMLGVNQ
ncbi:CgeB family protein [Vibrio cyclitrophicus]|uniref:CgeB family protein n=1 Tax=Vibrio cyclitrophicus TaxID=47951 RepID=UPI00148BBFD6|nr:glycosyltransferase [Vibrio cyclitrophicus]NOH20151.1 glycosyltransferase family 1 protein [Vibrio cyclitrophicus]